MISSGEMIFWLVLWGVAVAGVFIDQFLAYRYDRQLPLLALRVMYFLASAACLLIAGSFFFEGRVDSYWQVVFIVLMSIVMVPIVAIGAFGVLHAALRVSDEIKSAKERRRQLALKLHRSADEIKRRNGWGKPSEEHKE